MYINIKPIYEASGLDNLGIIEKTLKATEELGEMSAEVLKFEESTNASGSAKGTHEAILEEACDTVICVFDVLAKLGYNSDTINAMLEKKVGKWKRKVTT